MELWIVGRCFPQGVFCVSGEHFAEHCAFEGVSPDDVLPKEFCRVGRAFRGTGMMGCGVKAHGSRLKA